MIPLFKLFLDICLLRRGPQDVPASATLFAMVLVASLLIDVIVVASRSPVDEALLMVLINTSTMLLVVFILLRILGHAARSLQTLTALLGTGVIISCLLLPMLAMNAIFATESSMFEFFLVAFNFWSLVIITHILRHALEITLFPAAVLAIGYVMLSFSLVNLFLPQAG